MERARKSISNSKGTKKYVKDYVLSEKITNKIHIKIKLTKSSMKANQESRKSLVCVPLLCLDTEYNKTKSC